ncbi:MAG: hypothetical protein VX482_02035 [Candidatus Thermoplasmatota archaeon]|nr:hypothetical protein [Candidatus Thermoplasmatota archaeon]
MAGDFEAYTCPRDGSQLVPPSASERSAYIRNGIHHCDSCSGMLLNADAAISSFCSEKLEEMHEGFIKEGTPVDIDCPFCDCQMRLRNFSFQRLDGSLTDPIEIDGCPNCTSFWLDAGELHRLSPPSNGNKDARVEANALAMVLEILLQLPVVFV